MVIHEQSPTWIPTASGRALDLAAPDPSAIDIRDIARQLSRECRFSRATEAFYSVAQHSVLVSRLCPRLAALLHDAAEAYLGDASVPLKVLVPELVDVERRLAAAIAERFGLHWVDFSSPDIVAADMVLRATERRDLCRHVQAMPWCDMPEPLPEPLEPWPMEAAEALFLQRYHELA